MVRYSRVSAISPGRKNVTTVILAIAFVRKSLQLCENCVYRQSVSESEAREIATKGKLDNPRHERFAQLVASGINASESYRVAYGMTTDWRTDNADVMGPRLLGEVGIKQRVESIRTATGCSTILSLQESQEFLASVVRTPIGQIDEQSPLAQEVHRDGETGGVTRLTMPGKLKALELHAKLAGWLRDNPTSIVVPIQINLDIG